MKINKSKHGFTLIEVLIAMAVIAMILTPLYVLQGSVLQRVSRMAKRMHRIFIATDFLYEVRRSKPEDAHSFTLEKKVDYPETLLKYTLGSVHKESALAKVQGVHNERVEATWKDEQTGRMQKETLVTLLYKTEQEQEA